MNALKIATPSTNNINAAFAELCEVIDGLKARIAELEKAPAAPVEAVPVKVVFDWKTSTDKAKLEEFGRSLNPPIELKKSKSPANMRKDIEKHINEME